MAKILLIDDNKDINETTTELLEMAGHEVFTAINGAIGIKLAKSILPDLILCDIKMPGMSGFSVLSLLKKNHVTNNIPFVFFTAHTEQLILKKGLQMGADAFITKPFLEEELDQVISSCIRKELIAS